MSRIVLNTLQLACLASPARNEVFMQLRILGEGSAGDIARAIGKRPEAVHYHVKALVAAGLARVAFQRLSPKKPESVYEPIGKSLELPRADAGPEIAALARKAVRAGLAASARGYLKAAELAEADAEVRSRMHLLKVNVRLSPEDVKEFLRLIEEASKFASERRDEGGIRLVWSSAVYPPT